MGWTGKIIGALIGFAATHSPWGALLGAAIGHALDSAGTARGGGGYGGGGYGSGRGRDGVRAVSALFFRTTFEVMGRVAKSDGRVSEAEIAAARALMRELALGPRDVEAAIACFRTGKAAEYDAAAAADALRAACVDRPDLLRAFLELQLRAALAGNGLSPPARTLLATIAARLGFGAIEFAQLESLARARQRGDARGARRAPVLADCYRELDVAESSSDQEVVKAYRRQMSRHHPDKLVAKGLPESMAQIAKEKTQRIQEAYEAIRLARGMR